MEDWRLKIISAEADRLIELAAEDAGLRADLRELAGKILAATDVRAIASAAALTNAPSEPVPVPAGGQEQASLPSTHDDAEETAEPLRELTLGRPASTGKPIFSRTPKTSDPKTIDDEITRIVDRCQKKAQAARWVAARQCRPRGEDGAGEENAPSDPEIAAWADRLTDGFCWSQASEESRPATISSLEDVGGCFQTVVEALTLAQSSRDDAKLLGQILPIVAEAQSALRAVLRQVQTPDDPEQLQVFEWLKVQAARHRVYIKRFMRADDSADPARWPSLLDRIEDLREKHSGTGRRPQHASSFNRLRSCRDAVRNGGSTEQDWRAVIATVEDMIQAGVPPSNREIRDLLLPVIDELPDLPDIPAGFRLVLREIDRFLATQAIAAKLESPHESSPEVKEAARLLSGRSLVLIGGSRRREAQESLEKAFGLKELIWIETKEHQSVGTFEPILSRRDVALVLLAIRWSSHGFGEVKYLCDRHDKPLVRLPGGYNPNQVAAQVLLQCSGQLSGD
jgi:hypothetical protein